MRFHPPNFVQLDAPVGQCGIGDEFREGLIVDRQDFRNNEGRRFTDFCEQILNLPGAGKIFVIRTVLRQLQ